MTDTLAKRIRICAGIVGNGDELSRKTAIPRSTLESYMTGESEPKASRVLVLAQAADVDVGWLVSGEGDMRAGKPVVVETGDYAYVPLYDAQISSGHGGWSEGARVLAHLAFTRYSLRKKGLEPSTLAAVQLVGDSNEPELSDGDTVLVDLSRNQFQADAFYVVRLADHLFAKRLQLQFDGGVQVISANPAYPPMAVPKERLFELEVVGRVVWAGGWMI